MRAYLVPFFAALSLLLLVGTAHADPKSDAKDRFASGEARFKAGDYRAAIADFSAADALVPSPILSYNIALCHEKLGEDGEAVKFFKDYLKRRPDAQNKAAVETRIAEAEKRIAAKQPRVEGPAAPTPPPARPVGEGPSLPVPDAPRPEAPRPAAQVDDALVQQLPAHRASPPPPTVPSPSELGRGEPATSEPIAPPPASSDKKAKPLYKNWWFWAVVGVSAIIVIDMMSDDGPSSSGDAKPSPRGLGFSF